MLAKYFPVLILIPKNYSYIFRTTILSYEFRI